MPEKIHTYGGTLVDPENQPIRCNYHPDNSPCVMEYLDSGNQSRSSTRTYFCRTHQYFAYDFPTRIVRICTYANGEVRRIHEYAEQHPDNRETEETDK